MVDICHIPQVPSAKLISRDDGGLTLPRGWPLGLQEYLDSREDAAVNWKTRGDLIGECLFDVLGALLLIRMCSCANHFDQSELLAWFADSGGFSDGGLKGVKVSSRNSPQSRTFSICQLSLGTCDR